jgi:hypothetical protein
MMHAQRAVSGRGRSGGGRHIARSTLALPPVLAAGADGGGMPEEVHTAGTRLLHLSSIGEHEAEGTTSSDIASSPDDAVLPPYRPRYRSPFFRRCRHTLCTQLDYSMPLHDNMGMLLVWAFGLPSTYKSIQ